MNYDNLIKLIECPRDAMQGWHSFIPTEQKIEYINELLKVGFDTLDVGSFVSVKAIPQMADTRVVLPKLNLGNTKTKLLVIVANERGAQEAVGFEQVTYLGFPFSISETFQQKNTNSSIEESLHRVEAIQKLCVTNKKELVVYISMGFGNPYGDEYNPDIVIKWIEKLKHLGIKIFSLADTVGVAEPPNIEYLFKNIIPFFPDLEIGAHFHSTVDTRIEKLKAAHENGCLRFDSAIGGIGGCPMAQNDLVGNMDTVILIDYFNKCTLDIDNQQFINCMKMSKSIFV